VLPLLPSEAIELYTPMGERRWVPDWEPTFPAGPSDDDTDPGTVSPRRLTVTRPYGSSPSDRTSASECEPAQPRSEVVVTDLTALSARGQQVIERFAEDFGSFLDGWRRSIEAA
jgi:hypothetical protein